jgi:ketosteroid isomerase-like protein
MSRENVDLVWRASEALNQAIANNDVTPMLRDFLDRDVYWRAAEGAIDDVGGMRGHDAVRRYFEDWSDDFDNLTLTPQQFVELDDERVLVRQRLSGRAKHTGIETELTFFAIYTIREGRFIEVREYVTREEALEAVGLSEQDAHAES